MSVDLIGRQATIDAIKQHKTGVLGSREWDEGIAYGYAAAHRHIVEIIKQLPSAERHGRWEKMDGTDLWCCSVCGNTIYSEDETDRERFHKWCGRCGAKMDEVKE